ncbi:DUF3558 domain-containing protein [Streptomyces beihaiensis]|uniref:DUF3558 domain-containing protein n=1 Tax=Streptomyces beihaiensis TaxID=2984495 RepID=A0ABT3TXT6_9ACTN|nr:DUF3558 domain-containing protein [Streptomyces beihaiensis]MCX3061306.1 DUF3558 domain-containing protein [Streptomyces beihaiensis]
MQRKRKSYAYLPGAAALLAALLTGCSAASGSDGAAGDAKPGGASASAATVKPGKYHTLPEPCGVVDKGMLDKMLPGIAKLPDDDQREKAYAGTAAVTYDTGRRVGCSWKDTAADGSAHRLKLDFERVVSYDPTVSDDDRAGALFAKRVDAAGLPDVSSSDASGSSDTSGSSGTSGASDASATPGDGGVPSPGSSGAASATPSGDSGDSGGDDLQPRLLDGLGDEAFVDDVEAGPAASPHRTVTVVFRTSNVLVTVEYEAQAGAAGTAPDSKEMQDTARELAGKLVGKFGE